MQQRCASRQASRTFLSGLREGIRSSLRPSCPKPLCLQSRDWTAITDCNEQPNLPCQTKQTSSEVVEGPTQITCFLSLKGRWCRAEPAPYTNPQHFLLKPIYAPFPRPPRRPHHHMASSSHKIQVDIRPYQTPNDYLAANAILRAEMGKDNDELLEVHRTTSLVAVLPSSSAAPGRIVGVLVYSLHPSSRSDRAPRAKIQGLAVLKELQGRSIGSQLEEHFDRKYREYRLGAQPLPELSAQANSRRFYKKHGYGTDSEDNIGLLVRKHPRVKR